MLPNNWLKRHVVRKKDPEMLSGPGSKASLTGSGERQQKAKE